MQNKEPDTHAQMQMEADSETKDAGRNELAEFCTHLNPQVPPATTVMASAAAASVPQV